MYVIRDFFETLRRSSQLESVMLWGPRQVGKTTLLSGLDIRSSLFLEDLSVRQKCQRDPALALSDLPLPCLIDEAQYAPNLFPEIKLRIDRYRREHLLTNQTTPTMYYITGSNRLLLDKNVKESLAGRSHLYSLHGFSAREIFANFPSATVNTLMWKGGFPELYTHPEMSPQRYLNDYILSFVEKDIALFSGIEKLNEFQTVLGLLAARTGQFINISEIAGAAGVDQKTVTSWMSALQSNFIIDLVPPFHSNLSKRITKMKKLYFFDAGLCSRLQGHNDATAIWNSSQAGALFETLVFSEIMKTKANFLKDWRLFTWKTKAQAEIDFILQMDKRTIFIEVKMAIHGAMPFSLDQEARKVFPPPHKKIVVTVGGESGPLDHETTSVPLAQLGNYLLELQT